jgi:hypothetical protein
VLGPGASTTHRCFASFLAPNLLPTYRFLADYVAVRLDRPVELVVGTSFAQSPM